MGIQVEEANLPAGPQFNADGTPIQYDGPWPPLNVIQYPAYLSIAPGGISFQKVPELLSYRITYGVVLNGKPMAYFHCFTGQPDIDTSQLYAMCYANLKAMFPTSRFLVKDVL